MPERSVLEERFAAIVEELAGIEGVTAGAGRRGFGSGALQVDGRIFAMARRGGLVLKLPSQRVAELVASGDGTPFDAEAVKFTYDRLLDPKHPQAETGPFPFASFYYGAIKEVTVVDPGTVRFTLKQPFSPLLNNLTLNTGRIVSPTAVRKYGKEFASHPVGTGPFKFVSWDKNVRIVLEANSGYWAGPPKLERIVFRPLVEEQTRVTELLSGGVDFIVDVPPDNVAQVKKDPKLVYYEQPGPHIWWVTLNTEKKPFNDVRVRRAVNYAVNREAIASDLLKKTATAAIGPVPPSITWAFTDQVTKYPYDPARAKKLLADAGYPNGFPAVFWIPESGSGMQSPKTMAQAIQADLAAVAVQASIQTFEWGAYLNKYGKGLGQEADMGAMSFMLDPGDPDTRSAGSFFTNPILDAGQYAALQGVVAARCGPDVSIPRYPADAGYVKISAAWLIEQAGFRKGYTGQEGTSEGAGSPGLPGARISAKHTLALVNPGGATAASLLGLAREVRDGVRDVFGVDLATEPVVVGDSL